MAVLFTIVRHVTEGQDDKYGIWEEEENSGYKAGRGAFGRSELFSELGKLVYHRAQNSELEFEFFEAVHNVSRIEIENMSLRKRFIDQGGKASK